MATSRAARCAHATLRKGGRAPLQSGKCGGQSGAAARRRRPRIDATHLATRYGRSVHVRPTRTRVHDAAQPGLRGAAARDTRGPLGTGTHENIRVAIEAHKRHWPNCPLHTRFPRTGERAERFRRQRQEDTRAVAAKGSTAEHQELLLQAIRSGSPPTDVTRSRRHVTWCAASGAQIPFN